MPPKKNKRYKKKVSYRKNKPKSKFHYKKDSQCGSLMTQRGGLPKGLYMNFRTVQQFFHPVSAGIKSKTMKFYLNSCFKPFQAESKVQPVEFDRIKEIYNLYRVISGMLVLRITNETANQLSIHYYINTTPTDPANTIDDWMAQSGHRSLYLSQKGETGSTKTLKISFNVYKQFLSGKSGDKDNLTAPYTADPTLPVVFHMVFYSLSSAIVGADLDFTIIGTLYQKTLLSQNIVELQDDDDEDQEKMMTLFPKEEKKDEASIKIAELQKQIEDLKIAKK